MKRDEEGFVDEPCLSCDYMYVDDLFYEARCGNNINEDDCEIIKRYKEEVKNEQ